MTVRVAHIAADQRSHLWVDAPLEVRRGDRRFEARKWCLTGVMAGLGEVGDIEVGQEVALTLTIPFQGFSIGCDVKAECDSIDKAAETVTFRFVDLGTRERELLKHFIEELVSGSMVSAKDTIQRIDIPLLPVPVKVVQAEKSAGNRHARSMLMTGFYGLVGFFVFGYLGSLIYSGLFWKEISTAMISAPVDVVSAQFDGEIAWVGYKPGDTVKAGDIVLRVTNDELERDIDLADIAVRENEARLDVLQMRRTSELDKVRNFSALQDLEQEQNKSQIAALEDQYDIATQQFQRFRELAKKGLTTAVRAEDARRLMLEYRQRLEVLKSDVSAKKMLADRNRDKRVYAGREVIGDVMSNDEEIALVTKQVELAQQKRNAYLAQRERLAIRAPFPGVVQQLPRLPGSKVRKGEVIAVFEQSGQRAVTAFLQQQDLLSIAVGDKAVISVPAIGESFYATVEVVLPVDYSNDGKSLLGAMKGTRPEQERVASAVLQSPGGHIAVGAYDLPSGTPVMVMFERKDASRLVKTVRAGAQSMMAFLFGADLGGEQRQRVAIEGEF
jgi:multidrug resistance efflux pump